LLQIFAEHFSKEKLSGKSISMHLSECLLLQFFFFSVQSLSMQFIILSQDFITAKEKRGRIRESAEYLNKARHHANVTIEQFTSLENRLA